MMYWMNFAKRQDTLITLMPAKYLGKWKVNSTFGKFWTNPASVMPALALVKANTMAAYALFVRG